MLWSWAVYRPDAGYLGRIVVPQEPANCAFGDADRHRDPGHSSTGATHKADHRHDQADGDENVHP